MGPFAVSVSNSIDGKMLICHVNPSSRSFTPHVKRFVSYFSWLCVNRQSWVTFNGDREWFQAPDLLNCLLTGSIAAGSPTQTPCCSAWGWWSESSSSTTTFTRSAPSPRPPKSTWALWFWTLSSYFCPPQSAEMHLFERSGRLTSQGPGCVSLLIGSCHVCRWRGASKCWKSSRPTVWRVCWTLWGGYESLDAGDTEAPTYLTPSPPPQVHDTTSKRWQHLQTNQGPPAMKEAARKRESEGGGEERLRLINLIVYNKRRKFTRGSEDTCWY